MNGEVGYLLKVTQENVERHFNHMFKPVHLTASQVRLLKYLRGCEGHMASQKAIEQYLQASHPTVVGIVKRLEQKGFLRTEMDEKDKRKKLVFLTELEERMFQRMVADITEMENILTAGMSDEQVRRLTELLRMVLENIKRERRERDVEYDKDPCLPGEAVQEGFDCDSGADDAGGGDGDADPADDGVRH